LLGSAVAAKCAIVKRAVETAVFSCNPARFWSTFLDADYLRALYLEALQFKAFRILELTDTTRKLAVVPRMNLPGPIEKLMGDSFAYEDHGTLDRAKNEWTWRMVQPADVGAKARKELVTSRGSVRLEVLSADEVRRTDEIAIEAKMFGLGGLIESTAEKEFRSATAKEHAFLKEWLTRVS
jgi:hypothetical protein